MPVFAVTYEYTDQPGDEQRRDEHRPEHVAFLTAQHEAGRLLVSGPVDRDPSAGGSGALLIFAGESADDVAALLDGDPFRREGLIARRTVSPWRVFFGADRLAPRTAVAHVPAEEASR